MPTYQYACTECVHRFEQVQSFSDDTLTECPQCQGRLRKLFNAVGVVFKGSGFYRNDSREAAGTASPAGASDAAAEKSGGEKSGAEKSDSTKSGEKSTPAPAEKKSGDSGSSSSGSSGSGNGSSNGSSGSRASSGSGGTAKTG